MYRKIVWCYIVVLALLDISLNTKLTAQGKNHGASIQDTLVEGLHFQHEWSKEPPAEAHGSPLAVEPAALAFGAVSLGAAHARVVTLSNVANATLHLASVAGTTPDFHASFFDAKSLPPESNTTFSVVYLGRREGPVTAHLYIHTSLGVHKYSVSAVGVASEWGLWPLMGLRVPANATVESTLTLRNPTDHPVQVTSVYSSGAWVRLSLPGGGAAARARAWLLPPHRAAPIVRLRIQPAHHHPATAYVRIKANITGGVLVVGVEARSSPAGEYTQPLQIRLRARGHRDPAETFPVYAGSSAAAGARLDAGVWGARCAAAPPAPPALPPPAPTAPADHADYPHKLNGVKAEGAHVALLKSHLEPFQEVTRVAELTLDYGALWEGYGGEGGGGGGAGEEGAWCGGVVRLGRAHLPYSLRLLPGTLAITPATLTFITADPSSPRQVTVTARNEFNFGLRIAHISVPEEVAPYVTVTYSAPPVIAAGAVAQLFVLALAAGEHAALDAAVTVHTNVTDYSVPLLAYSGKLHLEWEWPGWPEGQLGTAWGRRGEGPADAPPPEEGEGPTLRLGAVGTSQTRRVNAKVVNLGARALCVTSWRASLAGASFALAACRDLALVPSDHPCRCVEPGRSAAAVLTLVAAARPDTVRGALVLHTPHAASTARLSMDVVAGRLAILPAALGDAAPYAWGSAPLVAESSMPLAMRVLALQPPPHAQPDPALIYEPPSGSEAEITEGQHTVGTLHYAPEKLCEPRCYTGLDLTSEEGAAWVSGASEEELARRADRALLAHRLALYQQTTRNISLHLHTTQVVQVAVSGWVRLRWPRLAAGGGAGWAGLAAVGAGAALSLRVRNPSRSHPLLLQPVLGAPPPPQHMPAVWEGGQEEICKKEECSYSADAFTLDAWQEVVEGNGSARGVREWGGGGGGAPRPAPPRALPFLLLPPAAAVDLNITFTPAEPSLLTAFLYLRNNLTIVEGLQLAGRGAHPRFELAGRRPGSPDPIVFEVTECGAGAAGVVKRTVSAVNSGAVPLTLRGCTAPRGFSAAPCRLALPPAGRRALSLAFAPDYTLARHSATLSLATDRSVLSFKLVGVTPARLLAACAAGLPAPPWLGALHAAGSLLALALLALVLAAAALDAERLLSRVRAHRGSSPVRAALDLRAVCAPPPAPPAAPPAAGAAPPRPPPPRRRKTRKLDPQAESRAFERWRASLAHQDDDESRSSEEERTRTSEQDGTLDNVNLLDPDEHQSPEAEPDRPPHADECESEREDTDSSSPHEIEDDDDAAETSPTMETAESVCQPDVRAAAAGGERADSAPRAPRRGHDARRSERRSATVSGTNVNGNSVSTAESEARAARHPANKHHNRKDKPSKRRERVSSALARHSPPAVEPRPPAPGAGGGAAAGGGAGAGGGPAAAGGAGVRWGASWSSVVARSAVTPTPPSTPLPPIGSDVRRRAAEEPAAPPPAAPSPCAPPPGPPPAPRSDHSLFYFNGEAGARRDDFAWRERGFHTPTRDFLDDGVGVGGAGPVGGVGAVGAGGGGYGGLGAVWGARSQPWPWPSYNASHGAVRPPPGFGSTPSGAGSVGAVGSNVGPVGSSVGALSTVGSMPPGPVGSVPVGAVGAGAPPRGARPFDPFHSLAAIWSRTALDWRSDSADERN